MAPFSHFGVPNPSSSRKAFSAIPLPQSDITRNGDCSLNIGGNFARPPMIESCRGGDMLCKLSSAGGALSESPIGIDAMHHDGFEFLTTQAPGEFHYAVEIDRTNNCSEIGHDSWIPETGYEQENDGSIAFPSINYKGSEMNVSTDTQPVSFIHFQDPFSTTQCSHLTAKTMNRRAFLYQNTALGFLSLCHSNNTSEFLSICTKVGLLLLACFSSCEMTKSRWGILVLSCTLLFKTPS